MVGNVYGSSEWNLIHAAFLDRTVDCHVSSDLGIRCALLQVRYGENRIIPLRCPVRARLCVCVLLLTAHDFDLQCNTFVLVTYFFVPTCLEAQGHFKRFYKFVHLLRVLQYMDDVR